MDWYYPVLVGAVDDHLAAERLAGGWERFVLRDRAVLGVRCVADQPWVTAAETCECALAHLRLGDRGHALQLLRAAHDLRDHSTGHYWTGRVYPEGETFPPDERTTYTGAAVVLCADALSGGSPASGLFSDAGAVPEVLDLREGGEMGVHEASGE